MLNVCYVQYMLNLSTDPEADERRRVLEDFGRFFAQWGLSPTLGRVWGYLLLSPEPASLDLIAGDLGISKSNASVTARQLEQFLMVRRSGEAGSRRALYEANPMSRRFFDQIMSAYGELVRVLEAASPVSPDDAVRARVDEAAQFFRAWIRELDQLVTRLTGQRR
jgi:DNA-binding transcriptional regulator GbsR (MarR family)